jgi:hypothetical protein
MSARSILLMAATVALAACSSTANYESPQLAERAEQHRLIAVLPFTMVVTGKPPGDLTAEQIAAVEEAESVAFQTTYYQWLLEQASMHRKHPIRIQIQPVSETNRLLAERGITVRDSWGMSAKSLARVLRVDAVVSTAVTKTRYLSGVESFAIETGFTIVSEITEGRLAPFLPWGVTTTHDIQAASEIIDALDGTVLWQDDMSVSTDWRAPANDVIAGFTRELAKRFPYRG